MTSRTKQLTGSDFRFCVTTSFIRALITFLDPEALNDDTKILTETDTETFFPIPNFPKPIPRLFFRYQIFRNRYRDFFSDTKFSETDTETFFPIPNIPKPIPRLFSDTKFFRYQNRYFFSETKSFWNRNRDFFSDTKFSETETDTYSVNSVQAVNSVVLLPSLMAFLDALASLGSMLETQSVT